MLRLGLCAPGPRNARMISVLPAARLGVMPCEKHWSSQLLTGVCTDDHTKVVHPAWANEGLKNIVRDIVLSEEAKIFFPRKNIKGTKCLNMGRKFLQDPRPQVAKDDVRKSISWACANAGSPGIRLISDVPVSVKVKGAQGSSEMWRQSSSRSGTRFSEMTMQICHDLGPKMQVLGHLSQNRMDPHRYLRGPKDR